MKNRFSHAVSAIAALALLLPGLAGTLAFAQNPGPQPNHDHPHNDRGREDHGAMGPMYNIMPEGMPIIWWNIPGLAQKIGLTAEQQKRMDDILHQRLQQIRPIMHDLHQQRNALQATLDANPPDSTKLKPLFEHVAQSRATLEVAQDQMLLEIRNVLTPDQWNKLQAENKRWRDQHPEPNPRDDRRDDHRNSQGKPGGNATRSVQPPA